MRFLTTDYSSSGPGGYYRIDADRKMRIEEYRGKTGLADLRSNIHSMASDPCWSPAFNGLIDLSGAELELSSNDVLRLALMMRQEDNRSTGWLAFVATDSATYGIVRMLGYWSRATDRLRIFQSRAEAEAWLERHGDHMPPGFAVEKSVPEPVEQPAVQPAALRNVI